MKLAGVDFPDPLVNAISDKRLVVFAGAGVSMGPPSNLPSFRKLASLLAEGVGLTMGDGESDDRLLGRVEDKSPGVQRRAALILQQSAHRPTQLHCDLLRLFAEPNDVRVVTTNFDALFERAATCVFKTPPKVFTAPTLPLGARFRGIVHVHGSVEAPEEMTLTHRDFGRAYLTEDDGWARRFLVDLFANQVVLFVGYSHNDTIMNYLSPSLPRDNKPSRYALVGGREENLPGEWENLGISPIVFKQERKNDYDGLYQGIESLANFNGRGILDWRQMIGEAVRAGPPPDEDEEARDLIRHALDDETLIRFFTESAEDPQWLSWLDTQKHLEFLFEDGDLSQRQRLLSQWLIDQFAIPHAEALFQILGRHAPRTNPQFWTILCLGLSRNNETQSDGDTRARTRWALYLASSIPEGISEFWLAWIADVCADVGALDGLLRVYEEVTARTNRLSDSSHTHHPGLDRLAEGLIGHFKQRISALAEPLLEIAVRRVEERHAYLMACPSGSDLVSDENSMRPAIERHEQNGLSSEIDLLVDAADIAVEWLVANKPESARLWSERLSKSDAPLSRRLAIYTVTMRRDLSANEKIAWLLESIDIHDRPWHHEVFRFVKVTYPDAGQESRTSLIDTVTSFQLKTEVHDDNAIHEEFHRYTWFAWLLEADPECALARASFDYVRLQHPEWRPDEHPDFPTYVSTSSGPVSSHSAAELLAMSPDDVLELLSNGQADDVEWPRQLRVHSLLGVIEEAAHNNADWGLDLAEAMVTAQGFDNELWRRILNTWARADLNLEQARRALPHLESGDLQRLHTNSAAYAISSLVGRFETLEYVELLRRANAIATNLGVHATNVKTPNIRLEIKGVPTGGDWFTRACNHPSGRLALYWMKSAAAWAKQQPERPQSLSQEHRDALDAIIRQEGDAGKLARLMLASRLHVLLYYDDGWVLDNLLPLFDPDNDNFEPAWDGFLTSGRITPPLALNMRETFMTAVPHVGDRFRDKMRERFVTYYASEFIVFGVDPTDKWIIELFKLDDDDIARMFTVEISMLLSRLDEAQQLKWWDGWLRDYWQGRLQGVPRPLGDDEKEEMLTWPIHLVARFPEAVDFAAQSPPSSLRSVNVFWDLENSSLLTTHPEAAAKLLISLGQAKANASLWQQARGVFELLLQSPLNPETSRALQELMARRGLL